VNADPERAAAAEMRVGVGSFAFGWATGHASPAFDEHALLAFASRHAVPVVQIADNLPVHTWPVERIDRLVAEAARARLTIELGARGLTDDHLQRYLALCRRVGARLLRFVADADAYEPSTDDLVALLRNAVPALSAAAVTIGLENHDRFPATVLRHIVDSVATPYVGICLDTANSFGAGESLREILDTLAPLAVNMHVKDVRISRLPHMMGFTVEGRPLGDGQLPIEAAIACVRRHRRCQTVVLEAWTPPASTIAETIKRERASAELSIERLKAVVQD
jgi:sugar phosphate isomerase/epimerase